MTEDPSRHQVAWVVEQYERMHAAGGRCQQCLDDDSMPCPELVWARKELQDQSTGGRSG